jgi:hypothetical protein
MITTKSAEERQRFWDLCQRYKPAREAIKRATVVKPEVIDIPFATLAPQPEAPRCGRLLTDGRQCELPAVEGDLCLRHYRWQVLHLAVYGLPLPEDGLTLQEVLGLTVELVLSEQVTPDVGHAVADLCRVMEKNMTRCEREQEAIGRRYRR